MNDEITARMRSEAALRASEERLHLLIEHAPVSVAMFDRDMRYLACSAGWVTEFGGALYFTGIVDKVLGSHHEQEKDKENAAEKVVAPVVFFDLPDLLVNLTTTGRKVSFLKLSISLELERGEDLPRVQAVMPRIVDSFQVYLRELRVEDLHGSAGIYRLKEELLARVNTAAAPLKVVDVLFKEMLVQ